MKVFSFETKLKALAAILAFGLLIHLTLGLMAAIFNKSNEEKRSRLRPRHVAETEVRGQTYQVHYGKMVDLKVRDIYVRRRKNIELTNAHFVARREILENDYEETTNENRFYKLVGGEVGGIKLKCKICSIVGSAGSLTLSKNGNAIDNADCVFRLGLAPVTDYEIDVGMKTTVRIVDGKSFSRLLRRPEKLISGSLSSPFWIVFDQMDVDFLKLNSKVSQTKKKAPELKVYTLTRSGDNNAMTQFKMEAAKLGYKLPDAAPSTLWYAIRTTIESKCENVTLFGVPSPKYCKNLSEGQKNGKMNSRYWGYSNSPFCSLGKDSGSKSTTAAEAQLLSLSDRRALSGLVSSSFDQSSKFNFYSPSWHRANTT